MTSRSSIVEKMSTLLDDIIHITSRCTMCLRGHQNKVVPLMKPSIFVDLSNDIKVCNCTC